MIREKGKHWALVFYDRPRAAGADTETRALASSVACLRHLTNLVDLGVEIDEHRERYYPEDNETAPVEVGDVVRVGSEGCGPEVGTVPSEGLVCGLIDYLGVDDLGLEEPGRREEDGKEGHTGHVLDDAFCQSVGLVHGLTVVERIVDSNVTL